jgi:hypothetical protein
MSATRFLFGFLAVLSISGPALAKGGSYHSEDRYNPEHITELPPDVRAQIESECPDPRALHAFAAYKAQGGILLHYEHFYCQGHNVFCNASGCLHQMFVPSDGRYKLERSYYSQD